MKKTFVKTKAKEPGQWPFENNKINDNFLPWYMTNFGYYAVQYFCTLTKYKTSPYNSLALVYT